MIYIILAFLTGSMVILSLVINSRLAVKIGVLQGTLINYLVGLIFSILVLIFNYSRVDISLKLFSNIPLWFYFGGVIGVIVVSVNNIVIPKIPTIYSTLLIFIGQIFTGIIIDFILGDSISRGKIIGGLLILLGMMYNFYIDKKNLLVKIVDE
ncbi:DMT family transporter [Maledivibacter halophilus]|uniref:Putative inner membrane exporter, YdcZ n=1 Tax=Maledivibacter halophilus TaxID=36842 RepID=A0A1T5MAH3_9FIRM|nr:DMT family transporter [Maledivibacter halophilus]SKC85222.1 Putative inner membrane exporter, YdcZ [Maledivibacter halophilus]